MIKDENQAASYDVCLFEYRCILNSEKYTQSTSVVTFGIFRKFGDSLRLVTYPLKHNDNFSK